MGRSRQALVALAVVALGIWAAFSSGAGIDYREDAGPAIAALSDGHLGRFLEHPPAMGSLSLLVRAPLVALADALGGGQALGYHLGALACVLAAAGAAALAARLAMRRGQSRAAGAIAVALAAAGPMTANAISWGHPEELLGAALCVAAVLVAAGDRPIAAGVALGLALATKQWAVVAVVPVLLAAPRRRPAIVAAACVVAAALWLPLALGNPAGFGTQATNAAHTYSEVRPMSVWFAVADRRDRRVWDGVEWTHVAAYSLPASLSGISHPLIALLPLALALLLVRRRRERGLEEALGLLALVLLLRCALDPVDNGYYHVPFLLALGGWELVRRRGLPLMTMVSSTVLWVVVRKIPIEHMAATSTVYVAWAAATAAALGWALYGPRATRATSGTAGDSPPLRRGTVPLPGTLPPPWPR